MDNRIAPADGCPPTGAVAVRIPEPRFGRWFRGTEIHRTHVLAEALRDRARIADGRSVGRGHILDLGCGRGIVT